MFYIDLGFSPRMEHPEPSIAENFDVYTEVLCELKRSPTPIVLSQKPAGQRQDWMEAVSELEHSTIAESMSLITRVRQERTYGFRFAVRADYLYQKPLFRFESDGKAHRNRLPNLPLMEQQVTTPHFHRYNEDGVLIAFKSEVLNDPAQCAVICRDVNFGLAHFCNEVRIRTEADSFPEIQTDALDLIPNEPTIDPLEGIPFLV